MPQRTFIAPDMVACIAEGRDPTADELVRVVDHITIEIGAPRPAFAWGRIHDDGSALLIERVARAAMVGFPRKAQAT